MNDAPAVNVTNIIDESRISGYQWFILAIVSISALFDGYDTQGIAYVAPVMAHDLGFPPSSLGPIFSAGLFGLTLGAVFFGMLADKLGRKQMIVWPMAIFGVFSLLTPMGHTVQSLVILRTIAGFGLGGTLPNVAAYVLEYSPKRMRSLLVNSTGSFFALGSIIAGNLAKVLIPTYGWQSTFYVGGVLPLIFTVVVLLFMPESVRYLLLSGKTMDRAVAVMRRIVPSRNFAAGTRFTLETQLKGITVKHLFTEGRAYPTILLWIAFVMNLFILVYMIFWMPTLLRESGQPLNVAIMVTVVYAFGGIFGGIGTGWIADRIGSLPKVLAVSYIGAAVFITIVAFAVHDTPVLYLAMFLTGFSINGGQPCLNTIGATYYPTAIRATGIGWALGVGRIGAVIGPAIGGVLVGAHFLVPVVIMANVIPAIIAAGAIVLFHLRHAEQMRAIPASATSA